MKLINLLIFASLFFVITSCCDKGKGCKRLEENSRYSMKCEYIKSRSLIVRCENQEAICYGNSCMLKTF